MANEPNNEPFIVMNKVYKICKRQTMAIKFATSPVAAGQFRQTCERLEFLYLKMFAYLKLIILFIWF